MTRWLDPERIEVPRSLRNVVGGHPLVAETLARRGIRTPDAARAFLSPDAYAPATPEELPDLANAAERLRLAIRRRDQIAIWGDFDADGQTATALLLETLRALDAKVIFRVPTRQEGHGVHRHGLERLIIEGARLILTCDTGVTAHDAVQRANTLDAEVIITDHHVLGEQLPPAFAVVNPHRLPSATHPLHALTGVGVAYQLARALDSTSADRALDLVALGTVADVGAIIGDNRYLVQRGLEALQSTERAGLQAIYQAADIHPGGLTEEHIGFVLGPRLNALGRLADASHGIELLTTSDPTRARTLATEVEGLNARRQWLTKQITEAAMAQIERDPVLLSNYHALVLSHPSWPGGVIGIVAGRLAERFGKPAVLVAAPPGQTARGSGRSVPGLDLVAALSDCAGLLEAYGGHPGAAGFSIDPERIPELRSALSRAVAARAEDIPEPTLAIDAYVEMPDLTLALVAAVSRLAPFGRGNPPLTLALRDLRVLSETTIGRTGEHRRITVEDAKERSQTVFWWHGADWPLPRGRFDLALTARASDYRGMAELQLEWLDARQQEQTAIEIELRPGIEVRDYRTVSEPMAVLQGLLAAYSERSDGERSIQVWAEGNYPKNIKARTRNQLAPGSRLVIWTLPPGPRELQTVLAHVQPEQVFLFGHNPGLDEPAGFLQHLAGLIKFALRTRAGRVDFVAAAARLAHRVSTVQAGLAYFAAQGTITIVDRTNQDWQIAEGTGPSENEASEAAKERLNALLVETAAYRSYASNAPASTLGQFSSL